VLPKGNVSKRHSRLLLKEGHIEIADLKSTNGTYVNGKKITEVTPVGASDRVYVGDFLITIDGLAGEVNASGSRRMPPPPPPPRASGSSAAHLPVAESAGSGGDSGGADQMDEEEEPLAAKPPRAGRMPPPPPPPPRRPPTPISSQALDDDGLGDDLAPPSPAELSAAEASTSDSTNDSTNNVGLFERRRTADHAPLDGAASHRRPTGSHPVSLQSEPGPPPGQPAVSAPDFAAAANGAAGEGLEGLLADPAVAQIVISGPDAVFVDRGAGLALHAAGLGDPNTVADTMWRLANMAVPPPSPDNPIVDVRFSDGTRLSAVFPPASPMGVVGSIRRPVTSERTLADLVPPGAKDVQTLLEAAVAGQRNLLLTGDVSAIASLAGALGALIPAERRVVSIGVGGAGARAGWTDLQPGADLGALVRVAAAFRADHLVVAEAVGPEVADLLLAAARGQEGLLLAAPARTVAEGLARVEALAANVNFGAGATSVAPLVCSTIDLVVHVVANADGSARVVDVAEPKVEAGHATAEAVISWRSDGGRRGSGAGKLHVTGVSARLGAALSAVGHSLPSSLVRR
jgi:pilus assembly protein CpaF